jgi:hypothetical protein
MKLSDLSLILLSAYRHFTDVSSVFGLWDSN